MKRREFIVLIGGAGVCPFAAHAQQGAKMLRVGTASTQPRSSPLWKAFEQRMAELGYQDGTNYTFDYLNVPRAEEYEAGYRKLAARDVDIMVASGPDISLKSALASSDTKPIVMVAVDYDPLVRGYVTSRKAHGQCNRTVSARDRTYRQASPTLEERVSGDACVDGVL